MLDSPLEYGMVGSTVSQAFARKGLGLSILLASALALSACQSTRQAKMEADPITTSSTSSAGPSFKRTEALSRQWKADPTNVPVTLAYAHNLDLLMQKQSQIEVLRTTAAQTRSSAAAQSQLGRAQLQAGDLAGAEESLARAAELDPRDVRVLSALGALLDQRTRHGEARERYQQALAIAPDNMSIVNNMAMSYALQGKLPEAEQLLRKASNHPSAKMTPRIRQNLALVIGLQGRFDEAKQVASQDLPDDQVQANMAYLQAMLAKKNTWAQLKEG